MEELTIETCIEKWINIEIENDDESTAGSEILHQLVNLSEFSFVTLIEKLCNFLTSMNDHLRNRATMLVVELLLDDAIDFNAQLIHHLVIFFNQRLSDYPSIIPSLNGLISISTRHKLILNCSSHDIIEILLSLTRNLDVQSLNQNIRQKIFTLMEVLLDNQNFKETDDSYSSSTIFDGILTAIEGEKDPRCLTIALRIIQKMGTIFPTLLQQRIERIFEMTSCYFPITFNPSPDDPYGVRPEILIQSLQDVLCCHFSMCDFVVPLMIDKINSEVTIAKKHAFLCLSSIVVKYNTLPLRNVLSVLSEFVVELVNSSPVQDLSLAKNDIMLLEIVSLATSNICKSILQSSNGIIRQHEWLLFADPIIRRALQEYASNPDSVLSNNFLSIIQLIGSSSFSCAETILSSFIPVILSSVAVLQRRLGRSTSVTQFSPEYSSDDGRSIITYSTPKSLFSSLIKLIQTLDPAVNYLTLCTRNGSNSSSSIDTTGSTIKDSKVPPLFPMLTKVFSSLVELLLLFDNSVVNVVNSNEYKYSENGVQCINEESEHTYVAIDHQHNHNHTTVSPSELGVGVGVGGASHHDHAGCCGGHGHDETRSHHFDEQELCDIIIHTTRSMHELLLRLPYKFVRIDQLIAFVHLLRSVHIQRFSGWLSSPSRTARHVVVDWSTVDVSESQLLLSTTINSFLCMLFQRSEYESLMLEDTLPFYLNILSVVSRLGKIRADVSGGVDNASVDGQGTYDIHSFQISCGILSNLVSCSSSTKLFDEMLPMLLAMLHLPEESLYQYPWLQHQLPSSSSYSSTPPLCAAAPVTSGESHLVESLKKTKTQIEIVVPTLANTLPGPETPASGSTSASTASATKSITSQHSKALAMKFVGLIREEHNQQEDKDLLNSGLLTPIGEIYRTCLLLHLRKALSKEAIESLCTLTTRITIALGSDGNALKSLLSISLSLLVPSNECSIDESTATFVETILPPAFAFDNYSEQKISLQLQILISMMSYIPPDALDVPLSTLDTSENKTAVTNDLEQVSVDCSLAGMIILLFRRCFLIFTVGKFGKGVVEAAANVIAIFLNKLPLSVLLFRLVNTTLRSIQTSVCSLQATSCPKSLLPFSANSPNLHLFPPNNGRMTKTSTAMLLVWSIRSLWMRPDSTQSLHCLSSLRLSPSEADEKEENLEEIKLGSDLSLSYFCEGLIQMLIACLRAEGGTGATSTPVHDDQDLYPLVALIGTDCAVLSREYPKLFPNTSYYRASPFWRQKLWSRIYVPVSQLLDSDLGDSATTAAPRPTNTRRRSLLLAVGGLVSGMPTTILTSHGPQLVHISVEALSYDSCVWNKKTSQSTDTDATETRVHVLRALEVLGMLLQDSVELIVPFLSKAIPRLCQLAEEEVAAAARVTALRCLSLISALPHSLLYPMKRSVLKSLSKVTDDYKRNVRMLAAKVKNKWLSLK